MPEPGRFLFVHLQKTGGTALFQRIRDAVGAEWVYPLPSDESGAVSVTDVSHLVEESALISTESAFVSISGPSACICGRDSYLRPCLSPR